MKTIPASHWPRLAGLLLVVNLLWIGGAWAAEAPPKEEPAKEESAKEEPPPEPVTTKNIDIPTEELALLLKPLTKDELLIEADAWLELLKAKVEEVSLAEIAVKRKNEEIKQAEQVKKKLDQAKESLEEVKDASQAAEQDTAGTAADEAVEAAQEAEKSVEEAAEIIDEVKATKEEASQDETIEKALEATGVQAPTGDDELKPEDVVEAAEEARTETEAVTRAAEDTQAASEQGKTGEQTRRAEETVAAAGEAQQALDTTSETVTSAVDGSTAAVSSEVGGTNRLDQISAKAETAAEANAQVKTEILDAVAKLREERTALIDRLNVVLDEMNTKLGKTPEGKDNEVVVPYRLYTDSVGGIKVDVSDTEAAWTTIINWVKSEEGGMRWAINIAVFLATIVAFAILGWILGKLAEKAFGIAKNTSILLRNFVVHSVRRVTLLIGVIIGLSALEINIGPLLAVIGAAGFVIAFALQDTLSNFASGIMIMLYKPFDVGDVVDVANVIGVVRSMNLVTTTITTGDNQVLVVPNNSIWGNIITNITGSKERRVDLVFGIGYGDDIGHAMQVMRDVVEEHPLVLKDPEPVIEVNELAESSVNFICRPWAKTADYWTVYWDLMRMVKQRFDAEGISIPFPQRDVHFVQESPKTTAKTDHPLEKSHPTARGDLADLETETDVDVDTEALGKTDG